MLMLILIEVLIIINIVHCLKQRKFYKEYGTELTGTVVSWNKLDRKEDQMNPVHYVLVVQTNEGVFDIESTNTKARKYHEGKEVTILIVPHMSLPELPPETLASLSPEELEAVEKARASEQKVEEVEKKLTILKDDLKGIGEIVFYIVASVFFGVLSVVAVLDRFM